MLIDYADHHNADRNLKERLQPAWVAFHGWVNGRQPKAYDDRQHAQVEFG